MATKTKKPELKEYADRIKLFIKQLDLENKDLAAVAEVRGPTITAYVNQESQPSMATLSKWVREFNINGHWLLTGEGEMLPSETPPDNSGETDPIIRRMREAKEILKDAPPEILYDVIRNISKGEPGNTEPRQSQKKAS